ncbi:uncharacterized protein RAG0_15101 [Rhynchosporium agropyri]|uniref:Uncharacterized protein n=1 Tax=Rhynchosporium agropyri TaxID=914238 RepID=A0A1E1LJK9_9HELO|nr:uncharacterized protein RAG0_15101 [Rhynchosporium agropyri]
MGATSHDLADSETLDEEVGCSLLSNCDELITVKARLEARKISGADFFRQFLRLEKINLGIDTWTNRTLYEVRCELYDFIRQIEAESSQPEQPVLGECSDASHSKAKEASSARTRDLSASHKTTEFLLDGTKFDVNPKYSPSHLKNKENSRALLELNSAVESWSYLSLEGALGHLMMHDHIQEVKAQNCSAAELFRAFIRVQGVRRGTSKRCPNYIDPSIKLLKAFAT